MTKKVKVQIETDVADIPKFCCLNLSEAEHQLEICHKILCDIRLELKKSSLEDVKISLANLEKIRTLMGKTDSMLSDIFGILVGYVNLTENAEQPTEQKKESV